MFALQFTRSNAIVTSTGYFLSFKRRVQKRSEGHGEKPETFSQIRRRIVGPVGIVRSKTVPVVPQTIYLLSQAFTRRSRFSRVLSRARRLANDVRCKRFWTLSRSYRRHLTGGPRCRLTFVSLESVDQKTRKQFRSNVAFVCLIYDPGRGTCSRIFEKPTVVFRSRPCNGGTSKKELRFNYDRR